jgi:hypothetical protein
MNIYRHGDLVLEGVEKLPEGLTPTKTKKIMVGSGGNPHSINNGTPYFKDMNNFVFGYLVASNTSLFHREHGDKKVGDLKSAKIDDGIYQLRKQHENTHQGMVAVED